MKLKFDEESTKRIVEGYYKKYEDFDCELEIKCSVVEVMGIRSIVDDQIAQVSFALNGKLNVNGVEESVRSEIGHGDVENAFKIMLQDEGYDVKKMEIDYSWNGVDETSCEFNGVFVNMSTKKKVKEVSKWK